MNTQIGLGLWLVIAFTALGSGCASFKQTASDVVTREPGDRFLGAPKPVSVEAAKDRDFAWLSEAAYKRIRGVENGDLTFCPDADTVLKREGWTPWDGFPDDGLLQQMEDSHLRVEVWSKKDPPSVVVAFGGTIFKSGKDWKSNLRWFLPRHKDEYTEIVDAFGPAFIVEYLRREKDQAWSYITNANLYSTGHSLGGGLAQQFAYSLPDDNPVPRVTKVYAFDPSPVTGYFSVDPKQRDINRKNLAIDRIYERGEALAIVRSLTSFVLPPSAAMPTIRSVRYALSYPANPISAHSMKELACKLDAVSGHRPKGQGEIKTLSL